MVLDDKYEEHPTRLGHLGYMLGLEWFSPEERSAIVNHIDEKGLDDHDLITLPNGQKSYANDTRNELGNSPYDHDGS
jgi:hypothetical protein